MIELVIFDVDGTLAETHRLDLLPGVQDFFHIVFHGGCPARPKIAIATNQGGVGMRYWMKSRGRAKYEKYPTRDEIDTRMAALLESLGAQESVPVYVSYRYRTKEGHWVPVPQEQQGEPRWKRDWRKPEPGMLQQAMADAGVPAERTLFVGDRTDDEGAAAAAGCFFAWAQDFFRLSFDRCEDLEKALKNWGA